MPFQPAPGVAQLNVRMQLFGQLVENVLHYVKATGTSWTAAEVDGWCGIVGLEWQNTVMPDLSEDVELLSVQGRDLSIEGGAAGEWAPTTTVLGGLLNPSLPGNNALCLTKRTARSGRSYRGRIYLPGITEADVFQNRISNTRALTLRDAVAAILIRSSASTIGGVVLSRRNQLVERPAAVGELITAVEVRDTRIDSQRRRLGRD